MKISLKTEDWQEQLTLEKEFMGEAAWLDHVSGTFTAPLHFNVTVRRLPEGVTLAGVLTAYVRINCVLCLEPFITCYTLPVYKQWWWQNETGEEDILLRDQEELELGPVIMETLLLELPMAPKCQEDCQGLCDQCGVNLNLEICRCQQETLDPRWVKLIEWQES